jgi:outer membrane protein assembly factor BamB
VRVGTGEIVWQNNKKSYEQSMLVHDGHLYTVNDNGIAFCWRTKDGEERWSERLKGPISASPVLVGNRIYAVNEVGTFFVYRADPDKFEILAKNQLGDESFATPTILGSRIYARVTHLDDEGERQEMLYCLGKR